MTAQEDILASLHREVHRTLDIYEEVLGRRASRTRDMLERLGAVDTCASLMISGALQFGFKKLRDAHRLDATFEQLVVEHAECFDSRTVEAARFRLDHAHELPE